MASQVLPPAGAGVRRTINWEDICFLACFPCVICIGCLLDLPNLWRKPEPRRRKPDPWSWKPAFPSPRPRALSLPLEYPTAIQRTFDQSQSAFLSKLPLELRRKIYEAALGGNAIHFTIDGGTLRGRRCQIGSCYYHPRFYDWRLDGGLEFTLSILRTCRQVYSEAIEFLYSSNTFWMTSMDGPLFPLPYLQHFILPARLRTIRKVCINWDMPCYQPWYDSWRMLSNMAGLKNLYIQIFTGDPDGNGDQWLHDNSVKFEPIKQITAPTTFIVVLPHQAYTSSLDVGTSNCVFQTPLQRPPRDNCR